MKKIGLMIGLILSLMVGNSYAVDVIWDGVQYQCAPSGSIPPAPKYECAESTSGYHCFESPNGKYSTVSECQKACIPPPVEYQKLNRIAGGSGDYYGTSYDTYAEGQIKRYILPLGELYPGRNIKRIIVLSTAIMDGRGDVSIRLTSPDGTWVRFQDGPFADETINAIAQSYPQGVNYPAQYLPNGYWILEVVGKMQSEIKLWWKCY